MHRTRVIYAEVHFCDGSTVTGYVVFAGDRVLVYENCALRLNSGTAGPCYPHQYNGSPASLVYWNLLAAGQGSLAVKVIRHVDTASLNFVCTRDGTWWHKFIGDDNVTLYDPHELRDEL